MCLLGVYACVDIVHFLRFSREFFSWLLVFVLFLLVTSFSYFGRYISSAFSRVFCRGVFVPGILCKSAVFLFGVLQAFLMCIFLYVFVYIGNRYDA